MADKTRYTANLVSDDNIYVDITNDRVGIGTTVPTSKLDVRGDGRFTGVVTATSFSGNASSATYATTAGIATYSTSSGIATYANTAGIATYATSSGIATYATSSGIATYATTAGVATALQNARNFSITGNFVTATAISFDGTGNVALAATIPLDSIGLGTYTTGDYVKNISGTSNQITVTGGTGEGSTPTLSIPSQFTAPQDVTVTRDLQVNRNLNVTGNITIGGTTAFVNVQQLQVADPDLVLGFRTDSNNNDSSNDTTANHGGIAIASTEGSPLVSLYNPGIGESTLATYKKIMWFKSGSFTGLNTDAWLINYAVGIGSTQFPTGTRLAAGNVQFTQSDLAVVRNINSSGIITGTLANTLTLNTSGTGLSGSTTYNNSGAAIFTVTSNATSANTASTIVARDASGNFSAGTITANLTGTASLATYATNAGTSTSVIGGIASVTQLSVSGVSTFSSNIIQTSGSVGLGTTNPLQRFQIGTANTLGVNTTGTVFVVTSNADVGIGTTNPIVKLDVRGNVNISGVVTASSFSGNASSATYATSAGIATYATTAGIATYATTAGIATYATNAGVATYATSAGIATYATTSGIATYATTAGIATYATSAGIATYATNAGVSTSVIGGIGSITQLQVTGISTFSNGPVFIGAATSTGTANQRLQVVGGASFTGTNYNIGVGTTNPSYTITVTDTGTPATSGLTNCLADFTTTANSYGQINLRNTSTGTNASSDVIVTADNGSDTTNFIDLGINNSGFSVGSWTINGANDGYLYTSDGNLSIGAINASVAKYISFFTGGTLISNERMRINSTGVGIGTTNPTSTLTVTGSGTTTTQLFVSGVSTFSGIATYTTSLFGTQASFTGVVTASSFSGNASSATYATTAGIATYATTAGIATYATTAGIATYATTAGISTYATTAGIATNVIGGIASVSQLNVSGITTVGFITATNLYVAGVGTFLSSGLKIRNPANTFGYTITGGAIIADRVLNLPVITATDTVATLGLPQTFSGNNIFSGNQTFQGQIYADTSSIINLAGSASVTHIFGTNQTTGTLTFGGTSGTGLITFGQATTSQQTDIQAGATSSGNIKTINLGTNGLSGSLTQINIGPTAGVGTVSIGSSTNVGIRTTNPSQPLHVQGNARVTGAVYDSTNSPGTSGQVLQSTVTGTQWTTASAGGSGKFDTTIDNVLYVQPTGTLDIVGVGTTVTQITTLPGGSSKYLVHSIHVTNISNGDAEITAGFIMNNRKVPASISVSAGSSGGSGIHTFTVGSASSITVGMAVTGTGNIGETTGIGSTAGFQFNTYVTSVDGANITLSKPMSGRATGILYFSPVSDVVSRLPVPVGSAVELLKQPMVLNALDSIVLQSTGAGTGIGSTSTAAVSQTANSNFLTVTAGAAITNFLTSGMLVQGTGSNTGIQTNTFVGVGYTPGSLSIPLTRPATTSLASTSYSFTEVVVPQDGALQATIVYQSSTDTAYQNGTGTVVGIVTLASQATSPVLGITSTVPLCYYGTGNTYPSIVQSIRVSNISDGSIYPGGDYPVWVGIGNSDTVFSWLAYNMIIPKNSSIELCESPKRLGIGQSIFAYASTPGTIEIQIAAKQKTS